MPRLVDLSGKTFGHLTAISRQTDFVTRRGNAKVQWRCRCVCGNEAVVRANALTSGHTRSCGCLRQQVAAGKAVLQSKELVGYATAHRRVVSARGKASLLSCADCGSSATDWSYDHRDEEELRQETVVNGITLHQLVYSLKPEHYQPKCRNCNIKDKQKLRLERET
jgi:hypothetical protein